VRQRSVKKEREMRQRRALMPSYPRCEIGPVLVRSGFLDYADAGVVAEAVKRCAGRSHGCHERRKRSSGGALSGPNIMGACNYCNGFVEDEPRIARLLGLVVRPGDSEWEKLGAADTKIVPMSQPRAVP
jgi:hypothetical protein